MQIKKLDDDTGIIFNLCEAPVDFTKLKDTDKIVIDTCSKEKPVYAYYYSISEKKCKPFDWQDDDNPKNKENEHYLKVHERT